MKERKNIEKMKKAWRESNTQPYNLEARYLPWLRYCLELKKLNNNVFSFDQRSNSSLPDEADSVLEDIIKMCDVALMMGAPIPGKCAGTAAATATRLSRYLSAKEWPSDCSQVMSKS